MVHTRAGSGSRNFGGSSIRCPQHAPQKMLPHSRQWCRSRVSTLRRGTHSSEARRNLHHKDEAYGLLSSPRVLEEFLRHDYMNIAQLL